MGVCAAYVLRWVLVRRDERPINVKTRPPLGPQDGLWDTITAMWDNLMDWMMRGFGEFVVNILFGVIKAQVIIMIGLIVTISNTVVDVSIAFMLIFVPMYFLLMLVP